MDCQIKPFQHFLNQIHSIGIELLQSPLQSKRQNLKQLDTMGWDKIWRSILFFIVLRFRKIQTESVPNLAPKVFKLTSNFIRWRGSHCACGHGLCTFNSQMIHVKAKLFYSEEKGYKGLNVLDVRLVLVKPRNYSMRVSLHQIRNVTK